MSSIFSSAYEQRIRDWGSLGSLHFSFLSPPFNLTRFSSDSVQSSLHFHVFGCSISRASPSYLCNEPRCWTTILDFIRRNCSGSREPRVDDSPFDSSQRKQANVSFYFSKGRTVPKIQFAHDAFAIKGRNFQKSQVATKGKKDRWMDGWYLIFQEAVEISRTVENSRSRNPSRKGWEIRAHVPALSFSHQRNLLHLLAALPLSSAKPSSHFHVAACTVACARFPHIYATVARPDTDLAREMFSALVFLGEKRSPPSSFKGGFRVYALGLSLKFRCEKKRWRTHSVGPASLSLSLPFFHILVHRRVFLSLAVISR